MTRRVLWRTAIVVGCLLPGLESAQSAWAVDTRTPWQRWERVLTSSQSRTALQAYHDVQIEAKFWAKSGATCTEPTCDNSNKDTCFTGRAFWSGDANNPGLFTLRGAFPKGNWCWKTCLLPRNGSACAADTGLNKSDEISVQGTAANALYTNGFPKAPSGKRNLTVSNGQTPFQWIGDTAWNAPINYGSSSAGVWGGYVTNRAMFTGFTNVLVAPAVQTLANPPSTGFKGFIPSKGCSNEDRPVIPAACHYWDSAYWSNFDALVKAANDAGIVVVVAGVMDPLNRAGTNQQISPAVKFPARADAAAFARNLAARLAGSFVIFSPSFDSKTTDPTADGVTTAELINTVIGAIRTAAPRHLIGLHLGGGSALGAYDNFHDSLDLELFQSGHGSAACEAGLTDDYAKFACRARDFALRFRCIGETTLPVCANAGAPAGKQVRPAVNVEGKYETIGDNLTRVQSRHIAWNSGLSGSFGYNIGVWTDIAAWTNPTAYSATNHYSDDDLGRMKGMFKMMPWSDLAPHHELLVEQNNFTFPAPPDNLCSGKGKADWLQLWKPHLALDVTNGYGLVYLPRPTRCAIGGNTLIPSNNIVLDRAKMAAKSIYIDCNNTKGTWMSPGETTGTSGFGSELAACSQTSGTLTFSLKTVTQVTCGGLCDRVLVLTKRTSGGWNSPFAASSAVDLQPDVELSDSGQSTVITGQLIVNGFPKGSPRPLSGPDQLFRKLPSTALDAAGNFTVVWEEEDSSGTDDIIMARFNSQLEPLSPPVLLNDTMDGQQAEPWVSGDDSGNTVAVWTSYSDDEKIAGDIYGKELDSSGQPLGAEFLVSSDILGNQSMPQVQMDGDGGFVVAWTEEPPPGDSPDVAPPDPQALMSKQAPMASSKQRGVYYRIYGANGRPHGPERHVENGSGVRARLSRLEVHRHGGFKLHWHEFDASGRDLGEREQDYGQDGNPIGSH